jgi:hypothetical protein
MFTTVKPLKKQIELLIDAREEKQRKQQRINKNLSIKINLPLD